MTQDAELKVPRADDSELAVIGAMLLSDQARDDAFAALTGKDFFDTRCQTVFEAMRALHDSGKPVDPITLFDWLRRNSLIETAGGAAFVSQAFNAVPHHGHLNFYAAHVLNASTLRSVIAVGAGMIYDATDNPEDAGGVMDRATKALSDLLDRGIVRDCPRVGELLLSALNEIDADMTAGSPPASVKTGISSLDSALAGGFRKGQLLILAARPSVGKTALAMQIAMNAGMSSIPTLLLSLEMPGSELAERILSQHALVDGHRLRDRTLTRDDRESLVEAASRTSVATLRVEDSANMSLRRVSAIARRMKRKDGLGLVVIDYLQLMQAADHRVPREQQVAALSRGLKVLARELDVPIVCLCQLNREVEKQNREPRLSDLRESGSIEQDADVVMFLHRDNATAGSSSEPGAIEVSLIVAKQRSGPTGKVVLMWHKQHCRFAERAASRFAEFASWNGDSLE